MDKAPGRIMVFISRRMIACDEASYLISFREDQRLGIRRWMHLKIHLMGCHLCRKYERQITELSHSMAVYRDGCTHESCAHRLSKEAGSRIGDEIQREIKAK